MKKEDEKNQKAIIGEMLRNERKKAGMSMLDVATHFGHHKSWLGDIETGRNNATATIMISLLDYYKSDTSTFTKEAIKKMKNE